MEKFKTAEIAILSAAVADFTPVNKASEKIKREKENYTIELKPTTDIAAELGKVKRNNQILVGFALETNNEEVNAKSKLERKNLDFIVLNSLQDKGAGFGGDTNKIKIYCKDGEVFSFDLKSKKEVAADIIDTICKTKH